MEFEVKTGRMKGIASDEKNIQKTLNRLNSELENCRRNLKGCLSVSASGKIDRAISVVHSRVGNTSGKVGAMGDKLTDIAGQYEVAERDILGQKVGVAKVEGVKSGGTNKNQSNKLNAKDFSDALSEFKKILEFASGDLDSDTISALTAFLGLLTASQGLKEFRTPGDFLNNMLKYSGSYLGFSSKTIKAFTSLAEKYGSPALKEWIKTQSGQDIFGAKDIGTAADMISLVGKVYSSFNGSDNWGEVLKSLSGDTSAVSKVYVDLLGLSGEAKKTFIKETALPYAALGSIGLYSLGKYFEGKDGNYTWQDVADLWLGSAAAGLNTLTSGVTFGFAKLNIDTFLNNVHETTDRATDIIADQGGPMWWQVTESVLFSPGVALWATGKSFVDYGWDIGEKINKIL